MRRVVSSVVPSLWLPFASLCSTACSQDAALPDDPDIRALHEASLRIASDHPQDAIPWLEDIAPDSPFYGDATLVLGHRTVRAFRPGELARIARAGGADAPVAASLFAGQFGLEPSLAFYQAADGWGLEDFVLETFIASLENEFGPVPEIRYAVAGDPRVEPDILAWLARNHVWVSNSHGQVDPSESLESLHPYLDERPDLVATWSRSWQMDRPTEWRRYLDLAPPQAPREWTGIYEAIDLIRAGDAPSALERLEHIGDFDAMHTHNHDVALYYARLQSGLPVGSKPVQVDKAWQTDWALQPLPIHQTRVIVTDGPRVLPFVQPGVPWFCSDRNHWWTDTEPVLACVERHLPELVADTEITLKIDPEGNVVRASEFADCFIDVARAKDVVAIDWQIHIVDRRHH